MVWSKKHQLLCFSNILPKRFDSNLTELLAQTFIVIPAENSEADINGM